MKTHSLTLLAMAVLAPCLLAQSKPSKTALPEGDARAVESQAVESQAVEGQTNRAADSQKIRVTAKDISTRLKMRQPKYHKIKLMEPSELPAPPPVPAKTPLTGADPSKESGQHKARLFGDEEKQKLPADVVATVDGNPITEKEVMELAAYLASYQGGNAETQIPRAFSELFRVKVVEASVGKEKAASLRAKLESIRKEAAKPDADFAAIAKKYSQCPSKDNGGSLDQFGRNAMVAPFSRHAFTTPVGKVSPVFATNFGYHFLKVTGKQKGSDAAGDMVAASHVLLMFEEDQNKLMQIGMRLENGSADIAVRNDEWRKKLPAELR